jgi:hypothetical protein
MNLQPSVADPWEWLTSFLPENYFFRSRMLLKGGLARPTPARTKLGTAC